MDLLNLLALSGTMFVLSVAPGPADFAVVARSLSAGARQGFIMIAGIVTADILFILAALYSLSRVAESMGTLFIVLKLGGAGYLIWLGVGALRMRPAEPTTTARAVSPTAARSSYLTGLLLTLADPKAILFYLGLLPAFVDTSRATPLDALLVALAATVVIAGVKGAYVLLADRARLLFESPAVRRKLDTAAGLVLIATGLFVMLLR